MSIWRPPPEVKGEQNAACGCRLQQVVFVQNVTDLNKSFLFSHWGKMWSNWLISHVATTRLPGCWSCCHDVIAFLVVGRLLSAEFSFIWDYMSAHFGEFLVCGWKILKGAKRKKFSSCCCLLFLPLFSSVWIRRPRLWDFIKVLSCIFRALMTSALCSPHPPINSWMSPLWLGAGLGTKFPFQGESWNTPAISTFPWKRRKRSGVFRSVWTQNLPAGGRGDGQKLKHLWADADLLTKLGRAQLHILWGGGGSSLQSNFLI